MTGSWPRCERCHHPTGTGRVATATCLECSEWPDAIATARYAFVLDTPASEMAHALKYEGWSRVAEEMGSATAAAVQEFVAATRGVVVVPVPTTAERIRKRGYNQAAMIALAAGRVLDVPVIEALERRSSARSQTALDPGQRRDNVRGAFRASRAAGAVRGATVILVDDVLTTGATVAAAAVTLHEAGASAVHVATFARAMPRRAGRATRAA